MGARFSKHHARVHLPCDKSEVINGSRDVTRLLLSNEVFDHTNAMNSREQLKEIEGMIITRLAHQKRADEAKAMLESLENLPEKGDYRNLSKRRSRKQRRR